MSPCLLASRRLWHARKCILSAMKALLACLLLILSFNADARSKQEIYQFRKANPCPVNGKLHGACKGWQIDHIIELHCGGPDKASNMQWLTIADHKAKTKRNKKCPNL